MIIKVRDPKAEVELAYSSDPGLSFVAKIRLFFCLIIGELKGFGFIVYRRRKGIAILKLIANTQIFGNKIIYTDINCVEGIQWERREA